MSKFRPIDPPNCPIYAWSRNIDKSSLYCSRCGKHTTCLFQIEQYNGDTDKCSVCCEEVYPKTVEKLAEQSINDNNNNSDE